MADLDSLQALFAPFNRGGSTMRFVDVLEEDEPVRLGLQDGYTVTRVGDPAFWLLHKSAGYNNGAHFCHTLKVVSWSQPEDYLLDLVDDQGRLFHVELIFPDLEPDLAAAWSRWRSYRRRRRAYFSAIDARILAEHRQIAEEWS